MNTISIIVCISIAILFFLLGILGRFLYAKKSASSYEKKVLEQKRIVEEEKQRALSTYENERKELLEKLSQEEQQAKSKIKAMRSSFDSERSLKENALKEKEREVARQIEELEEEKDNLEERKIRVKDRERRCQDREDSLKEESEKIEKEVELSKSKAREILEGAEEKVNKRLEELSGLTRDQAKTQVLEKAEREAKFQALKVEDIILTNASNNAENKAKEIILDAIGRLNKSISNKVDDEDISYSIKTNFSTIDIPISDSCKGLIIGKHGKTIRCLENILGVDIIIDDTVDMISISSYDCLRREVAKRTILDYVSRKSYINEIESIYKNQLEEVDKIIYEKGKRAFDELQLSCNDQLVRALGKLYFRNSYKQNVLEHSIEVARIASMLAAELKLDSSLARRAGLLHDIGKGLPSDESSSHAIAGANLLRDLGENGKVVNAVEAHHDEVQANSLEARLVQASDALSAGRPGSRDQSDDKYIERLRDIERVALSHQGVETAFVFQAGRDIRAFVKPEKVSDQEAKVMADEIAKEIRTSYNYLGLVRVTVIRESRFSSQFNEAFR